MNKELHPLTKAFLCDVRVSTLTYELVIGEPTRFPRRLPYIYLASPQQHGFHNHVNHSGRICYDADSGGSFIDVQKPQAVLHQAIDLAIRTLGSSLSGDLTDLCEEFEGYWRSLPDCLTVRCFFKPSAQQEQIKALCDPTSKQKHLPTAFYKGNLSESYGFHSRFRNLQSVNACYIPLQKAVLPPPMDAGLTTTYARDLMKRAGLSVIEDPLNSPLTAKRQENPRKKRKKRKKSSSRSRQELFLFSQPRPSGGTAMFGVAITGRSEHEFRADMNDEAWKVIPLSVQRHDEAYLLQRGGADSSLLEKTIAVVGCGAVGSRVAEQLALCGIGHLVIVDDEVLSEDNIYRHLLGGNAIGEPKAEAMANHLKWRLPHVDVAAKSVAREIWMEAEGWNESDLIVEATGDFTGMRDMNRRIIASSSPVPVVYCWLEACSLGGHALLVDGTGKGCLECLLNREESGLHRRCDFLEPYQKVTRDLTGCGGSFTPFSALDAIKTASLATELTLEHLHKRIGSSYRFWVGEDGPAMSAGLRTSEWYNRAVAGKSSIPGNAFVDKHCPVCGGLN